MKASLRTIAIIMLICLLLPVVSACKNEVPPPTETSGTEATVTSLTPDTGSIPSDTTVEDPASPVTTEPTPAITDAPETPPATPQPETVDGQVVIVSSSGYSDYRIVYPKGASYELAQTAKHLANYLNDAFPGTSFRAIADTGRAEASDHEILIGAVDRNDVPALTYKTDYVVTMSAEKPILCGRTDDETAKAVDYFIYNFASGIRAAVPSGFTYTCASSPDITAQSPEKYYYYEDEYTPILSFTYTSTPDLDSAKSKLYINGVDYTADASWSADHVTLSGKAFEAGDYDVWLVLTDTAGDVTTHPTAFSCGDGSVMNLYSGEVHAHTSESDGQGTVEEAYVYARDKARLDFFAVTDHSDSITLDEYQQIHQVTANKLNDPGTYVTLYGFEHTYGLSTGYYGHLNVINYSLTTSRVTDLPAFYKIMAKKNNVAVMFNHPGYSWGNFIEYDLYSESIDSVLNLAEIKGKNYDNEYALALTKGWHISPMYNEDNHVANWGNAYEYCGYALAPSLTRQNIMEAFENNRTYTTTDKTLKVYYKINDEWMGSRLDNPDKLSVSIQVSTSKGIGLGKIYLMAEDNIIVQSIDLGRSKSCDWTFTIDPLYDYYYVKVDGLASWCVTAPIWIENREMISLNSLDIGAITSTADANDLRATAVVKNLSDKTMTNITAKFYISSVKGFNEQTDAPLRTVKYDGTLNAGMSAGIYADVPFVESTPRITAIVTGFIDGVEYRDTKYLQASNLYITEVVPIITKYNNISDPFEYIELYNNSDTTIDLSGYSIRYYKNVGAKSDVLEANTWKLSGKIKPYSTYIIWVKATGNECTLTSFNNYYKTNFVLGENISGVSGVSIPQKYPVQLELLHGTTVINRVWYNWGKATDVSTDRGVDFSYQTDCTLTSRLTGINSDPTPGKLRDGQVPAAVK